jgi:hypothetical protein
MEGMEIIYLVFGFFAGIGIWIINMLRSEKKYEATIIDTNDDNIDELNSTADKQIDSGRNKLADRYRDILGRRSKGSDSSDLSGK